MKTFFSTAYTSKQRADGTNEWTHLKPAEVFARLRTEPGFEHVDVTQPMLLDDLLKFHTQKYLTGTQAAWPDEFLASRYRAQGQTDAAQEALRNKSCTFNLASGFHHAEPGVYLGFCMLNGLVLAHTALKTTNPSLRTAVLDLDAHFGNGCRTQQSKDTHFLHLDIQTVGFQGRTGAQYLAKVDEQLAALHAWKPDLVEYNAGMDVLEGDTVGAGFLTLDEAGERDRKVLAFCKANNYPVVICLAGGYQPKAIDGHIGTFREAVKIFG